METVPIPPLVKVCPGNNIFELPVPFHPGLAFKEPSVAVKFVGFIPENWETTSSNKVKLDKLTYQNFQVQN